MKNYGLTYKKKVIALAITSLLFVSGTVLAATIPTPKTYSNISGNTIVLSDVFDGVEDNADFYLAPAPENGKTRIITFEELQKISSALHLGWVPDNREYRTIIRRVSDTASIDEIKEALKQSIKKQLPLKDFEVDLTNNNITLNIPKNATSAEKAVKVDNVYFDASKMTVSATAYIAGNTSIKKEVKANVYYINKIPVLLENKRKGDIISSDDIGYLNMRSYDVTSNTITDINHVVGKTPRNSIDAMSPILASDLALPTLVKKGDMVIMKLKTPTIALTTQGYAVENGREGELIKIENISSKNVISALVTGEREVTITMPSKDNVVLN